MLMMGDGTSTRRRRNGVVLLVSLMLHLGATLAASSGQTPNNFGGVTPPPPPPPPPSASDGQQQSTMNEWDENDYDDCMRLFSEISTRILRRDVDAHILDDEDNSIIDFDQMNDIDPKYAAAFDQAIDAGVEVMALGCTITPDEIEVGGPLPFER